MLVPYTDIVSWYIPQNAGKCIGTEYTVIACIFYCLSLVRGSNQYYYYYYWYSALGPVWADTRAQSGDWYGSGTLHPGQVLRGRLPLLSPAF